MTSESIRDPNTDQLLTPQNSTFIIIDYQPVQVSSIRSMDQKELVFNIVHTAKAAVNYKLPIIHSTVNVATGRNKPPIAPRRARPLYFLPFTTWHLRASNRHVISRRRRLGSVAGLSQ